MGRLSCSLTADPLGILNHARAVDRVRARKSLAFQPPTCHNTFHLEMSGRPT